MALNKVKAGDPISASQWNELVDYVSWAKNMTGAGGVEIAKLPNGPVIRSRSVAAADYLPAKLTNTTFDGKYKWQEVELKENVTEDSYDNQPIWQDKSGGLTGTYEDDGEDYARERIVGNRFVPKDTIVFLTKANGATYYVFDFDSQPMIEGKIKGALTDTVMTVYSNYGGGFTTTNKDVTFYNQGAIEVQGTSYPLGNGFWGNCQWINGSWKLVALGCKAI